MSDKAPVGGPVKGTGSPHSPPTPQAIPNLSKHWEDYILSIATILLLPLMPLMLEFWRVQKIESAELLLAASMYAVGVGMGSRSRLMFVMTIFMGVMCAFAYGVTKGQQNSLPYSSTLCYGSIGIIFLVHSIERYNIHIIKKIRWQFPGAEESNI